MNDNKIMLKDIVLKGNRYTIRYEDETAYIYCPINNGFYELNMDAIKLVELFQYYSKDQILSKINNMEFDNKLEIIEFINNIALDLCINY